MTTKDGTPQPAIKVRREKWKDGRYHSVARNAKGHMLSWRKWHDKSSTIETHDRAVFNEAKQRTEKPERFVEARVSAPVIRDDIRLKQPPEIGHKRYSIVCKIVTSIGNFWFLSIESNKKTLNAYDLYYIKRRLVSQYAPKSHNTIYTEMITAVIPVKRTDRDLGTQVTL